MLGEAKANSRSPWPTKDAPSAIPAHQAQRLHLGPAPAPSTRLMSLDALRGFDMLWIIGGGELIHALAPLLPDRVGPALADQFTHVPWQGLHCYDVIWPLFMLVVGVAMRFSLANRRAKGETNLRILSHAARRALILFILGMIAQGNLLKYDLSQLYPCYSVLHGIAAGYLIATLAMLYLTPKQQGFLIAAFLLIYWALLMMIPVPGVGAGVLTPEGNAAIYVDRLVLGRFQHGDNTWFLSYLGFAASVMLGVLAGELLFSAGSPRLKALGLLGFGMGILALGLVWSLWFPIIKLLWTGPYVLVTGGISLVLLAIFYLVIDVWELRRWAFFFSVIGMNSIAVYMATRLFDFRRIGDIFVGGLAGRVGPWAEVLRSMSAFLVIWLLMFWMYRKKTFIRL